MTYSNDMLKPILYELLTKFKESVVYIYLLLINVWFYLLEYNYFQ
jgi:hypothetical protein